MLILFVDVWQCSVILCVSFELNARLSISNSNSKFYLIVDLSSAILRCVLCCVIASYVQCGSLVSAICGLQFTEALGHPLSKLVLLAVKILILYRCLLTNFK